MCFCKDLMRYTFLSLVQEDRILFRLVRGTKWLTGKKPLMLGGGGRKYKTKVHQDAEIKSALR